MKVRYAFFSLFILIALFGAEDTHAQTVTSRSVTTLSDTVTMYTITYEAGFLNADVWMPLAASRTEKEGKITYASKGTKSYAAVLSTQPLTKERLYHVPKRERGTFTLLVLEVQPNPSTDDIKRVQVTSLPHMIQRQGEDKVWRTPPPEDLAEFVVPK
jgi:hypothetical protein